MMAETMVAAGPGRGGRMSRQRKRDAVLRLLRGEDLEAVSRALGVTAATLSGWRDAFLSAGEASLATRATDGEALENERLKARLGEMLLEARAAGGQGRGPGGRPPFGPQEVEAMSLAVSPSSGKPYGVARVCRVWGAARATLYRHRLPPRPEPRGGGARPGRCRTRRCSRRSASATPFHGEGHRKVWARLRSAASAPRCGACCA